MSIGERIEERLKSLGMSQAELARRVGMSQPSINALIHRNKTGSRKLSDVARELQTTVHYLEGKTGDPGAGALPAPSDESIAEQLGIVKIEEVDLSVGMGAGYLDDSHITSVSRWIPADWVRQFTDAPPEMLSIARPFGDSMYPTINDRDIILFDRSARSITRQDAIWVLVYGGLGTIKRVRAMPDGSYKLMADNPAVREETAHDDEMFVIGRVVGVIRRT